MTERDLGGLRAYAREVAEQFETLRQGMGEFQQELRAVSVSSSSSDRYVTATVDARGQLTKLVLDPRIYRRQDSAALARSITETIREAAGRAAQEVARISEQHAPGMDVSSYLRGDLAGRFSRFDFVQDQVVGGTD